ncbi:BnaC06g29780D [Brassica napus]|uniref:BnaC06g29780D protein n=1 Tax=Brassica napus TaxID=3708 RepID=A0A078H7W5_BRANA|nr:BnaC06g29780D [Brassica napus]
MSMKLSEDFTKKLRFSEEGERIRKLERSWSKLEDSVEFDEEEEGGEEEEFSFACVNAEGSSDLLFDQNDGVSETDDEEINQPRLRKSPDDMKSMAVEAILLLQEKINDDDEETVKMQLLVPSRVIGCVIGRSGSVITQIRKRTNASIRISKENNDDLVEVIMILTKVQIFSPSFVLYSTSKSLVIVREDVLGDRCSVSARNPPPARSDHSGFTLPPFVSSVPEYASVDFDQRRETGESSLGMVSSDRFYGYESSFPARDHGLVSVGPYSYGGFCLSSQILVKI